MCHGEALRTRSAGETCLQLASAFPGEMALAALTSVFPSGKWTWFSDGWRHAGPGGRGPSDRGHIMVCRASLAQGQTLSLRRWVVPGPEAPGLQSASPGPGGREGPRKPRRGQASVWWRAEGYVSPGEPRKCGEATAESVEGWGGPNFDEPGRCSETDLCLVLPGERAREPERVRAWLRVAQQLALGADRLAWGPGHRPPRCEGGT